MGAHQQEAKRVTVSSVHNAIRNPPLPISNRTIAVDGRKSFNKCTEILYPACGIFVVILVMGSFITLLTVFTNDPVPNCHVDSVILHPFNISSSQITAYWNTSFFFSVSKKGPLSYPISYYLHDVQASVFYKNKKLCSAAIRPIYPNVDHQVEANIGVSSAYLNTSIGDAMASDWSLGAINFNIKVNALVLGDGEYTSIMSFACEDVTIGFADGKNSTGTMIGGSRKCRRHP